MKLDLKNPSSASPGRILFRCRELDICVKTSSSMIDDFHLQLIQIVEFGAFVPLVWMEPALDFHFLGLGRFGIEIAIDRPRTRAPSATNTWPELILAADQLAFFTAKLC